MQTDPQDQVTTGLTEALAPEQTPSVPAAPSPPIHIAGLGDDVTVRVDEINHPAAVAAQQAATPPPPRAEQPFTKDELQQAEDENLKRDFTQQFMAANHPPVKEYTPPPVPPAVAEQTRLEMEAGKRTVAVHESRQALRPRPQPNPADGKNVAVLRPEDFVPNMQQGHVPTSSYRPV